MATLRDTIGFICFKLPNEPHVLRLAYLLYLADWCSAVVQGRRVTTLKWTLGAQGPEAQALAGFLENSKDFRTSGAKNHAAIVTFDGRPLFPTLTSGDRLIFEEIVRVTELMAWSQVQRLIHQSDPVIQGKFDQILDLEDIARKRRPLSPASAARPGATTKLASSERTV